MNSTNVAPVAASLETLTVAVCVAKTFDMFEARQAAESELETLRLAAIEAGELCRGQAPSARDWADMESAEAAYEAKRATLYGARR